MAFCCLCSESIINLCSRRHAASGEPPQRISMSIRHCKRRNGCWFCMGRSSTNASMTFRLRVSKPAGSSLANCIHCSKSNAMQEGLGILFISRVAGSYHVDPAAPHRIDSLRWFNDITWLSGTNPTSSMPFLLRPEPICCFQSGPRMACQNFSCRSHLEAWSAPTHNIINNIKALMVSI